jgi:hypothetical protein
MMGDEDVGGVVARQQNRASSQWRDRPLWPGSFVPAQKSRAAHALLIGSNAK